MDSQRGVASRKELELPSHFPSDVMKSSRAMWHSDSSEHADAIQIGGESL